MGSRKNWEEDDVENRDIMNAAVCTMRSYAMSERVWMGDPYAQLSDKPPLPPPHVDRIVQHFEMFTISGPVIPGLLKVISLRLYDLR